MRSTPQSATEALMEYLDIWTSREKDAVKGTRDFHHPDITVIGSARHEVFRGLNELDDQTEKENEQIDEELYDILWSDEISIDENSFIVIAEVEWTRVLRRNSTARVLHRISSVWVLEDGRYKMINWHSSAPDGAREHEVFPGSSKPQSYEGVTVVFADFVGFTTIASSMSPQLLVDELNDLFTVFDTTTTKYGLDKIKTIGDAYMLVGGLTDTETDHTSRCIMWAHDILQYLSKRNHNTPQNWNVRIGMHTGDVIGGIVGHEQPVFDLWGDTVNTASRMESHGESGKVNVSAHTYACILKDPRFKFQHRGKVSAKGKGDMDMYFVGLK